MSVALKVFEQLTEAGEDRTETFESIEDVGTRETALRLQKEVEGLHRDIKELEVRVIQALHRQILWVIVSVTAIMGGIRLLEWLLAHLPNS